MARVLVVDDENLMRTMVEVACRRLGHEALCAATLAEGRRLAAAGVDVILLDMLLPDGNGLDAQQELAALPDAPDIVVITGHGDGDAAEKALRGGVWDFLMKPVRVRDVEETLSHVLEARDRRRSRRGLELEPGQVAGSGPAMQAALAQLEQAAHSDVNVLLLGETGVGKEVFARAIHQSSGRSLQSYVKINCAAIPGTLLESELFGYADGAFSGAAKGGKIGKFELANHGTLLLDEIGEMPLDLQSKLLRVLQEKEIERVGGIKSVEVDVRIICCTNQNLEKMVQEGRFREDLYYRINVVELNIPPLRERLEDIPPLCSFFLEKVNEENGYAITGLEEDVLTLFDAYPWPGNVRELEHVIERAAVRCKSGMMTTRHVDFLAARASRQREQTQLEPASLRERTQQAELESILQALDRTGGNKTKAARLLGIDRSRLYSKLKKYHLGSP